MTTNVYNHEAVIHGFVRKALRYAGDEADNEEREQLEEDLPEYAETILTGGGYDLDKRIAALQSENERLKNSVDALLDFINGKITRDELKARIAANEARRALGEVSDG